MRPRLIFMACLFTLVCFGLLMVYSASSVEALHENGSATFFLGRQAAFAVVGVLALIAIVRVLPDSWFGEDVLRIFLIGMIGLLLLVFLVGSGQPWRHALAQHRRYSVPAFRVFKAICHCVFGHHA